MEYIILDMEWNQPLNYERMVKTPVQLRGEIIQIGAVKVDESYRIIDTFKIMVAPKYYRKMNKKVSSLTGIETADLQYGFPFRVALRHFKQWCGDEFVFLTWGSDDVEMLRDNMIIHSMDAAWIPSVFNIQIIFDAQISKENRQISLKEAMERLGESALEAHDALHDASNTVCVCRHLDMAKGLEEYAELQRQMESGARRRQQGGPVLKSYQSREEALQDEEMIRFICPKCGMNAVCVDAVRQNMDKFIAIGKCESGDEWFVRFKFMKWADGTFGTGRILYEMNDDNKAYYMKKKQKTEEKVERYLKKVESLACQEQQAEDDKITGMMERVDETGLETGAADSDAGESDWMEDIFDLEEFRLE